MELIEKIVHTADTLFSRFGVRSVSMDDVAREISISKKTLYKCFRDKNDLVKTTIGEHMRLMDEKINLIIEAEPNPIRQITQIAQFIVVSSGDMNPSLVYDLRKYHHECYEMLNEHRDTHTSESIRNNILKGIEMGLFRPELNVELVTKFYSFLTYSVFDSMKIRMENIAFDATLRELIRYHLYGITTPKGVAQIEQDEWLNITKNT
jgi:TetR/AcrR family transcriptional regulator, cholesterol catabolism regulator